MQPKTPGKHWFASKTARELIAIIRGAADELAAREDRKTDRLDGHAIPIFPVRKVDVRKSQFEHLPPLSGEEEKRRAEQCWRFVLINNNEGVDPLPVEVCDEVAVGRFEMSMNTPPLDLTKYNAIQKGVSRRHALFRPTPNSLFLLDQESLNGTFVNGVRLKASEAHELNDKDVISFANLHFLLRIIESPKTSDREHP